MRFELYVLCMQVFVKPMFWYCVVIVLASSSFVYKVSTQRKRKCPFVKTVFRHIFLMAQFLVISV